MLNPFVIELRDDNKIISQNTTTISRIKIFYFLKIFLKTHFFSIILCEKHYRVSQFSIEYKHRLASKRFFFILLK